ncbi:MAG: wax ester/triacylglycerol synthase domain-containing protein, partial [Mycobacterium sp.]
DPDFNFDYHVRRLRAPAPGTLREVFDIAEVMLQSPLDISRPLWMVTLVEDLPDGRAALLMHLSHAITDGIGSIEMFANLYDLERDPPPKPPAPLPAPEDLSANDLARQGLSQLPGAVMGGTGDMLAGAVRAAARLARHPLSAANGVVDFARSAAEMMTWNVEPSPLLRGRSLASHTEAIDIDFSAFRAAAKAGGGSINDAYLAGLCGALRRYHAACGMPIDTMSIAVPVNLRSEDDPAGGNRFAGVKLAAPIGIVDVTERIREVHTQMCELREERAADLLGVIAPAFSVLPDWLLGSLSESFVSADVQASNVPAFPGDVYLAGAKVLRQYGIGPLPGVAVMAVLVSCAGTVSITVRYDKASVTDDALFSQCLLDGFNEVLALGGQDNGLARAVSTR